MFMEILLTPLWWKQLFADRKHWQISRNTFAFSTSTGLWGQFRPRRESRQAGSVWESYFVTLNKQTESQTKKKNRKTCFLSDIKKYIHALLYVFLQVYCQFFSNHACAIANIRPVFQNVFKMFVLTARDAFMFVKRFFSSFHTC